LSAIVDPGEVKDIERAKLLLVEGRLGAARAALDHAHKLATATEKHPETWLGLVESEGHGIIDEEVLTSEAEGDEFLLMGLRLKEGVDPRRFEAFTGRRLNERRLRNLEEEGLIQVDGSRLAVTPKGFPVLNAVIAELAA